MEIKIPKNSKKLIRVTNNSKKIIFKIGKNSHISIIEKRKLQSEGKIIIKTSEGSTVDYLTILDAKKYDFSAELGKKSSVVWYFYGNMRNKSQIKSKIIGENSESFGEMIVLLDAKDKSETRMELINNHKEANTKGLITVKGLGRDKSKAMINGLIRIDKKASNVSSFLKENILLLSSESEIQAEPNLEILNSEVEASHSATFGDLDKNMLYYMGSRGISEKESEKILIKAFFKPIVEKIKNKQIQKELLKSIL